MQPSFQLGAKGDDDSTDLKTPRINLGLKELDKITRYSTRDGSFNKSLAYDNIQQVITLQGLAMLLKEYGIQTPFVFEGELLAGGADE